MSANAKPPREFIQRIMTHSFTNKQDDSIYSAPIDGSSKGLQVLPDKIARRHSIKPLDPGFNVKPATRQLSFITKKSSDSTDLDIEPAADFAAKKCQNIQGQKSIPTISINESSLVTSMTDISFSAGGQRRSRHGSLVSSSSSHASMVKPNPIRTSLSFSNPLLEESSDFLINKSRLASVVYQKMEEARIHKEQIAVNEIVTEIKGEPSGSIVEFKEESLKVRPPISPSIRAKMGLVTRMCKIGVRAEKCYKKIIKLNLDSVKHKSVRDEGVLDDLQKELEWAVNVIFCFKHSSKNC
jgi:hypothetical protein